MIPYRKLLKGVMAFLVLLFAAAGVRAQQITVHGTVTDAQTGDPLIGVNILVVGTSSGTATDNDGHYSLAVPSPRDTLRFSFIGYKTRAIPIKGRSTIDVALTSKITKANQLVVTAYGKMEKREDVVGAVTSLSKSDLNQMKMASSSNLTTSLAGRVPGIIAFQRSGEPGKNNATFFVRGVTSFGFDRNPLILIDNIKSSPTDLAELNPDDIASFSVLKDATATALYGSEAANGVLIIKTKEGSQTPLHVSLRVFNTFSRPTQVPKLTNPITFMKLANQTTLSRLPGSTLPYSFKKIEKTESGESPFLYPAINWRKKLFKNYTMNQVVNLHVSGGGKIAQYFVSGSFNKQNGLLKVPNLNNFNNNIDFKTYSLRSNININLTKSTELITKISGRFNNYQGPLSGGQDIYNQVVRANPVRFPAKFPIDSSYAYVKHPLYGGSVDDKLNPYANLTKGYKHYVQSQVNAQFGVNHDFSSEIKGLNMQAVFNIQRFAYSANSRAFDPFYYHASPKSVGSNKYTLSLLNPKEGTNYLDYTPLEKTVTSKLYFQAQANYVRTYGKKNGLNAFLVFSARNQTYDNVTTIQASLPHRNVNLAGRLSYNYNHIYYAEFDFGYNASERFAKNHRWGFFPSVGVAWNISNQKFWEPLKNVINTLKIRATFGFSGNDKIGASDHRFLYLSDVNLSDPSYSFITGSSAGYSLNGVSVQAYKNNTITWEKAKKINFGIHLGLFNDLFFKVNVYHQDRTNILQKRVDLPASLGLSYTPSANVGEAKSSGFTAHVKYQHTFDKNLFLAIRGNYTLSTSKFVKYSEPSYTNAPNRLHIGQPIGRQYGLIAKGLFIDKEDVENSPNQTFGPYGPGDIKYVDVNRDGVITNLDKVPLGYPTAPQVTYGFGFSLSYKNFDFSTFFQGLARESFWINTTASNGVDNQGTAPFVGGHQVLKAYAESHWTTENENINARYPHFSTEFATAGSTNNSQISTWFMRNGSFLRLKDVEIGYSLPINIVNNLSLRLLRIYVSARNLYHFSAFKLWDPEMAGEGLGYPLQQTLTIGIHVKF